MRAAVQINMQTIQSKTWTGTGQGKISWSQHEVLMLFWRIRRWVPVDSGTEEE